MSNRFLRKPKRCFTMLQAAGCTGPRQLAGRTRPCKACHAAYTREWRKTHPLTEAQKRKDNARSYAGVYKRRGKITPQPCKVCGAEPAEMHHPDYSKPLLIDWLCRAHHLELHRQIAAE